MDFWSRSQRARSTLAPSYLVCMCKDIDYQYLHDLAYKLYMMREGTPWIMGHNVKVNSFTVSLKPCGYDTDYSYCPATSKLQM